MKKLIITISLIFLFITSICFAGSTNHVNIAFVASGTVTYLLEESFDPAGTDATWADIDGSTEINYDYTTSPAPLEGTQSGFASGIVKSKTTITASDTIYATFMLNFDTAPTIDVNFFYLNNGDYTTLTSFKLRTSRLLRMTTGGNEVNGPTLTAATTYYVKVKYVKGTGANQEGSFWVSTDGSTWGTEYSTTTGTGTAQVNTIVLLNAVGAACDFIFDDVRAAIVDIDY